MKTYVSTVKIEQEYRHAEYAQTVLATLEQAGFRAEVDSRNERMNQKIRAAQLQKVPYMLVVGDREADAGAVAVRSRDGGDLGATPLGEFAALLGRENKK